MKPECSIWCSWSRIFLEMPALAQHVKKWPAPYEFEEAYYGVHMCLFTGPHSQPDDSSRPYCLPIYSYVSTASGIPTNVSYPLPPLLCVLHPCPSLSWFYFPNNIETHMPTARQRLCKYIPKHTRSTIGHPLLRNGQMNEHSWQLKAVFSVESVPISYEGT
jgi:hypothetical protein